MSKTNDKGIRWVDVANGDAPLPEVPCNVRDCRPEIAPPLVRRLKSIRWEKSGDGVWCVVRWHREPRDPVNDPGIDCGFSGIRVGSQCLERKRIYPQPDHE